MYDVVKSLHEDITDQIKLLLIIDHRLRQLMRSVLFLISSRDLFISYTFFPEYFIFVYYVRQKDQILAILQ